MEPIIPPVDKELLKAELTRDRKLQDTNKGGNELYIVTAHDSPNVMKELGRLREEAYRASGGCSGKSMDIDEFDTMENPYKQIVVWDPEAEAILGGYRYILGPDVQFDADGVPILATAHMFRFSDKFIKEYLPHTVELGRSFVSLGYQSSKAGAKAIFALDNLWDGIAAVILQNKGIRYFFGKMTIYSSYDKAARDLVLHFLEKHFADKEDLVKPVEPVEPECDVRLLDLILKDDDLKTDYRNLKNAVRKLGTSIPPLVNSYINTSSSMKMFGTGVYHEFADAVEPAILVNFNDVYEDKKLRHIEAYTRGLMERLRRKGKKA